MALPTYVSSGGTNTADGVPVNALTLAGVSITGSSRALLVWVGIDLDGFDVPVLSCTCGGQALIRLGSRLNSTAQRIEVWGMVAPPTGTQSIVVTLDGGFTQEFAFGYVLLQAVPQSNPFTAVSSSSGTSSAPALAVACENDQTLVYAGLTTQTTAPSSTGSQVNRINRLANNAIPALIATAYVDQLPGEADGSVQFGWTKSGSQVYAAIGVAVRGIDRVAAISAAGTVTVTGASRNARVTAAGTVATLGYGPDFALRTYLGLPTLVELTSRLRKFHLSRGRNSPLEPMEAGTASVTMKNDNGAPLDPSNVSSPYYPNVRVLSEMVLARRRGGVTYPRFVGRTERIVPTLVPPNYQEQEFQASDAFEVLAGLYLESEHATLTTALPGTNNDLRFTAREAGGRGDDITVEYVVEGNNAALDGATNDPISGNARFDEFYGTLQWYEQVFMPQRAAGPPPPTKFEVRGTDISITVSTDSSGNATATAAQIKSLIESVPELDALVSVELAPGNTGTGVVETMAKTSLSGGKWQQELTGARIHRALDAVGWPEEKRQIDAGLCEVVPQGFAKRDKVSALAHMKDVAGSELGYLFVDAGGSVVYHDGGHRGRESRSTTVQATIVDANAGAGYYYRTISPRYEVDDIYNLVSVTPGYSGATPQVVEDLASQLLYSPVPGVPVPREYARSSLLANDSDALLVANTILAAFKDARVRFPEVQLRERASPAGWTEAIMARELGDLIQVRTKLPGHTTVGTYDCYIERISEEGSPGSPVDITFGLSLAAEALDIPVPGGALLDSTGDDFILDSGTQGVLG